MSLQTRFNWWLVAGLACLTCDVDVHASSAAPASSRSLLTNNMLTKHSPTLNEPFQASNFETLPHVPCVTLFHKEGRVGCGTYERDSVTGILVPWSTAASSSSSVGSYVAVMDQSEFTNDNLDSLASSSSSSNLVGILVLNATTATGTSLSPAPQNPQGEGTPSEKVSTNSEYAWNTNGDGLTNRNLYGIPTVLVTADSVADYLLQVATDQASQLQASSVSGDTEPKVVAEFNYYMGPETMDSQTCLEWRDTDGTWSPKCLPLGGNSIWATAGSPELVQEQQQRTLEQASSQKDIVIMATSMDATSMFHDAVPAANAAASNILTLLMAAKLLGESLSDQTLDALPKRIMFAFFQGESYGFLGSRSFLQDVAYPGFTCDEGRTVYQNSRNANDGDLACLYPLRPKLAFSHLGDIAGMIALDQVGVLSTEQTLYVHGDAEEGTFDGFLANVLLALSSDDFTVAASSVEGDYPPTPLTSLMQLSEGGVGGAILSGYDEAFATGSMYHSHLDSNFVRQIDMDAVAAAATIMARAALATASDEGDMDSDTAAQNAATTIPSLSSDDETLLELADCFFTNGNCKLLIQHGLVERANTKQATGLDFGLGSPLGTPPNYYTGIYNADEGQPFVQVGTSYYGAYTGDEYGKKTTDAFVARPRLLEMAIHGLLNDYLGRGSRSDENTNNLKKCSNTGDCSKVSYCSATGDSAVCTGGKQCVCSRANYHIAVDEAFVAAPNNFTGYFDVSPVYTADEDGGDGTSYIRSAMYTEAFWSSSVGVRVYRDAGKSTGTWALVCGILTCALCIGSTLYLKRTLKKEKLY